MNRPGRGFTLVELLVAVGVVLALAAIIAPVFFSARHQAKKVTCLSNLRQLGLALQMYEQDDGAYPPQGWVDNSESLADVDPVDPLQPYTKGGVSYHCPETDHLEYNYRASLELDERGQYQPLVLEPASVIVYCLHKRHEYYLVLRQNGSLTRVADSQVGYWKYRDGQWLPPGTPALGDGFEAGAAVFPDEPWPLPFVRQ